MNNHPTSKQTKASRKHENYTQAELEDTILALLSAAEGSLLDNVTLINTLDASKSTWEEVNQSLKVRVLHFNATASCCS
jgi:hypothetical protein